MLRSLSVAAGEALAPSPPASDWSAFYLSPYSTLLGSCSECCRGCLAGPGRSVKLRSTLPWWQTLLFASLASSAVGAGPMTSTAEGHAAAAAVD